jgi:ligand-binding sensor domain-containing protein
MMQDATGYLWFTTDMGVSRFNGYEFKNFTTEDGLADNTNFGVFQDKKGRTWFRSFSGKLSYFENEKIKTPACNSGIPKLLGKMSIVSMFVDEHDTIWAGLNENFFLKISPPWKQENMTLVKVASNGAYLLLFSEEQFIFGGASPAVTDLFVYNKNLQQEYTVPFHLQPVLAGHIRMSFTALKDHSYIMLANDVLARFDKTGIISQKKNRSVYISLLAEDDHHLLAATYDGVQQFANLSFSGAATIPQLDGKIITAVCRDHERGLWFCTEGNGVFCIPFRNFLYYTTADGLPESKISCVTKAGDKIICGHLDGTISVLTGQKVSSVNFNHDTTSVSSASRISTLAFDGHDKLFVGTIKNVFTYSFEKNSFTTGLETGSKSLIYSSDYFLWSLQFRELIKYDPENNFKILARYPLYEYCDNLSEDSHGAVWICPIHSILKWDSISGMTDAGKNIPALDGRIVDVQEDKDGNMWMVSRGKGVIIKRGNDYFSITQKDGLAGNMCRAVFIDQKNIVWIGTNNGLSRIEIIPGDSFAYRISSYTSRNGLLTNEVNDMLVQDNKLWLFHNNGVSVFDPDHFQDNSSPPPVFITALMINGDTVVPGKNFSVPHDRNYFTIGFMGLSYKDPGHLEYRYKMEGVDSVWIYTNYTSIKYQTLPPGTYRFIVFAKNNDGYWSTKPATFSFTILPAWWQTWVFRIIIWVSIILLFLTAFKFRLDVIRRREEKKTSLQNRIAAIELNALRAQMNPHFVFNSINSVQYFITNNDPDSSQKYLSKFARLIRYVVDNSKLTSIPIKNEIEALTLYLELEAIRFGNRFEFEIKVSSEIDTTFTQIPSMLIQPYVENSIWHGIMHKKGNGRIEISMEMKNGILCCIIRDNGIGRKKSMELKREKEGVHRSVGMSNTKERLEIINQVNNSSMSVDVSDIMDENGNICGTNVEIHIPIS